MNRNSGLNWRNIGLVKKQSQKAFENQSSKKKLKFNNHKSKAVSLDSKQLKLNFKQNKYQTQTKQLPFNFNNEEISPIKLPSRISNLALLPQFDQLSCQLSKNMLNTSRNLIQQLKSSQKVKCYQKKQSTVLKLVEDFNIFKNQIMMMLGGIQSTMKKMIESVVQHYENQLKNTKNQFNQFKNLYNRIQMRDSSKKLKVGHKYKLSQLDNLTNDQPSVDKFKEKKQVLLNSLGCNIPKSTTNKKPIKFNKFFDAINDLKTDMNDINLIRTTSAIILDNATNFMF